MDTYGLQFDTPGYVLDKESFFLLCNRRSAPGRAMTKSIVSCSPLPGPPTLYQRLDLKGKLWVMRHIYLTEQRERRRRRLAALRACFAREEPTTEEGVSEQEERDEKQNVSQSHKTDISSALRGLAGSLMASTPEERKVMLAQRSLDGEGLETGTKGGLVRSIYVVVLLGPSFPLRSALWMQRRKVLP